MSLKEGDVVLDPEGRVWTIESYSFACAHSRRPYGQQRQKLLYMFNGRQVYTNDPRSAAKYFTKIGTLYEPILGDCSDCGRRRRVLSLFGMSAKCRQCWPERIGITATRMLFS